MGRDLITTVTVPGTSPVDLNASAEAEPRYASLGLVREPDPSMRLSL